MSSAESDRLALTGSIGDEPGNSSGIDELTKNSRGVEATGLSDARSGDRGSSAKACRPECVRINTIDENTMKAMTAREIGIPDLRMRRVAITDMVIRVDFSVRSFASIAAGECIYAG